MDEIRECLRCIIHDWAGREYGVSQLWEELDRRMGHHVFWNEFAMAYDGLTESNQV